MAPIEAAPKDGTPVDLWIVGTDNMVDFYDPHAKKIKGNPLRHGRATNMRFMSPYGLPPQWYPMGGLGMPLSPDVTPTHWRHYQIHQNDR